MMGFADNTFRPASQGSEELVPSRYALRVGEIDVLVISDGVLNKRARFGESDRVSLSCAA